MTSLQQQNPTEPFAAPGTGLRGLYGTIPGTVQTPPTTPKTVTGSVTSFGTSVAGTGFAVARSTTGTYVITFTPVFSAKPNVQVTGVSAAAASQSWAVNPTPSQVTVFGQTGGIGLVDMAFDFVAQTQ